MALTLPRYINSWKGNIIFIYSFRESFRIIVIFYIARARLLLGDRAAVLILRARSRSTLFTKPDKPAFMFFSIFPDFHPENPALQDCFELAAVFFDNQQFNTFFWLSNWRTKLNNIGKKLGSKVKFALAEETSTNWSFFPILRQRNFVKEKKIGNQKPIRPNEIKTWLFEKFENVCSIVSIQNAIF